MIEIKCPHDLNKFHLGEPAFENPFPEEECKQRRFYGDCFHCFATAIASRDHQLKSTINKNRKMGVRMNIDWAIKHCEEVAQEKRDEYQECLAMHDTENAIICEECGKEHEQLAKWLKELKSFREKETVSRESYEHEYFLRKELEMKVEEIALRHEIRQMMNEAGINKETLKDMVQEVLHEELEKAIRQKFHENNIDDFVEHNADNIIRQTTKNVIEQKITDRIVGRYFNKMKVSVDIRTEDDKSLISDK